MFGNSFLFYDRSGSSSSSGGSVVTFHNNIYIADNGNDSTGDGSLSKPYLTGTKAQTVIAASSPTATNLFYVHDQRTTAVSEDLKWMPFVKWESEGGTDFSGNLSLHSLFGSIATDGWSWWGGYRNYDATKTISYDVSSFSVSHGIELTLTNAKKVPCTYIIKGNDNVDSLNGTTFIVNEINFNTAGFNIDGSSWRANCTMSSGVTRRIRYCEGWQLSSIKVSQGTIGTLTWLDVAYCGTPFFQSPINTLALINTGAGNSGSYLTLDQRLCSSENNGGSFALDITNDGVSVTTVLFDNSVICRINSFNSLTNIGFGGVGIGDYLLSYFAPVNFTPTDFTPSGLAPVTANNQAYGSYLNGIDIALGSLKSSTYPPKYIRGFQLTYNIVGPPITVTVGTGFCTDSTNSFNMILTNPVTLDTTSASIDNGGSWSAGSWYGIWLYEKSSDSSTIMKFSLSFSSPAAISGYDKVRLVGSVKAQTIGTNILVMRQTGLENERTYTQVNSDTALGLLTDGHAVEASPGTFSCASAMSPIATEINLQYEFTPGIGRAGDTFNITDADFNTEALAYFSGIVASIKSSGIVGYLPVNSSQNLSYFLTDATDNLTLIATGYKESL